MGGIGLIYPRPGCRGWVPFVRGPTWIGKVLGVEITIVDLMGRCASAVLPSRAHICNISVHITPRTKPYPEASSPRLFCEQRGLSNRGDVGLDWENRVANLVINSSNVGTVANVASLWSDHTNSDPLGDFDTAIQRVCDLTGYLPNRAVIGWEAWRHLKRNTALRALLFPSPGGTEPTAGLIRTDQVANVFDLDRVLVGGAVRNTAAEGLSIALSDIWGPHAFVYYVPNQPSKETPSYGYSFRWIGPGLQNLTVEDLGFDRRLKGNILDVSFYQDERVVGSNFGTVIASVV